MGHESNNIFCSPTDPFHSYCAGMIKSVTHWIIQIVDKLSFMNKQMDVVAEFERRYQEFPKIAKLPHIPNTYFRNGLLQNLLYKGRKTASERNQATGLGGGYRSADWVAALFQIIFVIGIEGDIVPNSKMFTLQINGTRVNLGNVTKKIMNCAFSLLDSYIQSKKDSFSDDQIYQFEISNKDMHCHLLLLWELRQTVLGISTLQLTMRKPHNVLHYGFTIRMWGSLSKCDTGSYERNHKVDTKHNYERTSRRKKTINEEQTKYIQIQRKLYWISIIKRILNTSNSESVFGNLKNETVEIMALGSYRSYEMIFNLIDEKFDFISLHNHQKIKNDFEVLSYIVSIYFPS